MAALRWKRIEPGYYQLMGTNIEIANMKGQSVKWSGLISDPWVVRRGTKTVFRCESMKAAKKKAELLA